MVKFTKALIVFTAALLASLSFCTLCFAYQYSNTDSIQLPDGRLLYLNLDFLAEGFKVYGEPADVVDATPPQEREGQFRYLGYSGLLVPYTNSKFPVDPGSFPVNERDYIEPPWRAKNSGCYPNDEISDADWPSIYEQIKEVARSRGYPEDAFPYEKKYYGLLTPSLNGAYGSLKVLFYRSGYSPTNWRYETIENLVLKYPDYTIRFAGNVPQMVSPGDTVNLTLSTGQNVNFDFSFIQTPVDVYLDYGGIHKLMFSEELTYGAGARENINVSFTMPDFPAESVKVVAVINRLGFDGNFICQERTYANNICEATMYLSKPPGPPGDGEPGNGGEEPPPPPGNLSVTNIGLFNSNGQPVSGTVEVNKPYKVKATFKSTFDTGGWAIIRFYVKRASGAMDLKDQVNVHLDPYSSYTKEWDWTGMTENVRLIATIDYRWWDQQGKWVEELFDGQEEEYTYSDNMKDRSISGTEVPGGPPETISWGYPLYYHPARWVEEPVYRKEPVYGWKKVKFIRDDTKYIIRTYLYPSSGAKEGETDVR